MNLICQALKCQPGSHCTLYAFLMDYIKVLSTTDIMLIITDIFNIIISLNIGTKHGNRLTN